MPYIGNNGLTDGTRDDQRGEPSRTLARTILLAALAEQSPGILDDLLYQCQEQAAAVLATAGQFDQPQHLLRLDALVRWRSLLERANTAIAQGGNAPVRDRLRRRAERQGELFVQLVEWAQGNRLTDSDGRRNAWLLQHAIHVAAGWHEWGQLSTRVGRPTKPAREFRKRHHDAPPADSELGPLARDFVWLVRYALVPAPLSAFAPKAGRALVIRRARDAADRAGFDLPSPLRPKRLAGLTRP